MLTQVFAIVVFGLPSQTMVRVSVSLALLVLAAAASSAAATPGAALRGLKAQSSGGCTSSTPGME